MLTSCLTRQQSYRCRVRPSYETHSFSCDVVNELGLLGEENGEQFFGSLIKRLCLTSNGDPAFVLFGRSCNCEVDERKRAEQPRFLYCISKGIRY
jgi:hypothetical protein